MKIRVYIGVIGSGKDYLASKECDTVVNFADALRSDIWRMVGWEPKTPEEYEIFKKLEFRGNALDLKGHNISFTGRDLLQRYGTDIRRAEDPDYWINRLLHMLGLYRDNILRKDFTVGISDCKFENEALALIQFSSAWNIPLTFVHTTYESDKYFPYSDHESEKFAQQFLKFKGTEEEFDKYVKELVWERR